MHYPRHTLLDISEQGRRRIFAELMAHGYGEQACGELLLPLEYPALDMPGYPECAQQPPIPGIARREEMAPRQGLIPVGFVSWRSGTNGRLRIASFAHPEEIDTVRTPQSAAQAAALNRAALVRTPALRALAQLLDGCGPLPVVMGLWGTAALEVQTGCHYTHQGSDLDVLFTPARPLSRADLQRCLDAVLAVEQHCATRVDAELTLPSGYGISLKELLNTGKTVLGKGLLDVALIRKEDVFAALA